jgi:thiol-disulfide isomerase/thioredoxin
MLHFAVVAVLCCPPQDPAAGFRYRAGDVHVAVEHTLQRETDDKLAFTITTSHTTERRYTVLAVDSDGTADLLVEEHTGPQQLHEYVVRSRDERAAHLAKGFDAASTVQQRVLRVRCPRTSFRCEPARDEPAVFYLQEIAELPARLLVWPTNGGAAFEHSLSLPRLRANAALQRRGDVVEGPLHLTIADPRVHGGAEVACPEGSLRWELDAATALPKQWRIELRYPRFPIGRPNERIVTGELRRSTPLGADDLAALRADFDAFAAVRDAFFAGRFPAALALAETFAAARPQSRLRGAVQAEVDDFRRQVPRFGQEPPALPPGQWFGGEATTLQALRGRVFVLDFWAVWCVPCVAGMGHLLDLRARLGGEGLTVLGLTRVDKRQSIDDVRRFGSFGYAESHEGRAVDYPLVVLTDDSVHEWFAVKAIPKLVVLDRQGKVYWEQTGGGGEARLDRIVEQALLAK